MATAARKLGIDSTRLASYEHGRVPVRLEMAARFAKTFDVNPEWLASGKGLPTPYREIPKDCLDQHGKALFSEVYDAYLCSFWAGEDRDTMVLVAQLLGLQSRELAISDEIVSTNRFLLRKIQELLDDCENSQQQSVLLGMIAEAIVRFLQTTKGGIPRETTKFKTHEKHLLTEPANSEKVPPVKSPLAHLRTRLNLILAEKGKMQELADYLKAPYTSVSRWCSEREGSNREPSGETALLMLRWVELQERK